MNKIVILAFAMFALLPITVTNAAAANAAPLRPAASHAGSYAKIGLGISPGAITLYDQNANDGADSINSQNYDEPFDIYSDQGADDFTVPAGHTWTVKQVNVTGIYFGGSGPARSVNVIFYNDAGGMPGTVVAECDNARAKNGPSFAIKLNACSAVKLPAGTYWLSVIANQNFNKGEWGWEVNSVVTGNESMWQNSNGGYGVCQTWDTVANCITSVPTDFMFSLIGKDRAH